MIFERSNEIELKSADEIALMRESCQLAADVLVMIEPFVVAGISTGEIDRLCHEYIVAHGAYPSPLGYRGFPKATCTSVNEVVCHGIPSPTQVLRDGDIINVDVTTFYKGFHGDCSATFCVGTPGPRARHVVEVARVSLERGMAVVKPGARVGDIGAAIQKYAEGEHCSVVREFVGHGIGRNFHDAPEVPHFGKAGRGARLREGMTFTIEPMINLGEWRTQVLSDGWTAITIDHQLSAQFEHTVLVVKNGVEILTLPTGRADRAHAKSQARMG